MSDASGYVIGMSCGFGGGFAAGIGAGIASGKKKACEEIREHLEMNDLQIVDREGRPVPAHQILEDSTMVKVGGSSKTVLAVLLGLLVLAALLGLFMYRAF